MEMMDSLSDTQAHTVMYTVYAITYLQIISNIIFQYCYKVLLHAIF